jgi:hypothetical protein
VNRHIVARLARSTLEHRTTIDWEMLASRHLKIRDAIELGVSGTSYELQRRVLEFGGFYLPNAARNRVFNTKTARRSLPCTSFRNTISAGSVFDDDNSQSRPV